VGLSTHCPDAWSVWVGLIMFLPRCMFQLADVLAVQVIWEADNPVGDPAWEYDEPIGNMANCFHATSRHLFVVVFRCAPFLTRLRPKCSASRGSWATRPRRSVLVCRSFGRPHHRTIWSRCSGDGGGRSSSCSRGTVANRTTWLGSMSRSEQPQ